MSEPSLTEVARALSVSPATLRRWGREGIVPLRDGALDAGGARPGADRRADARPRALARRSCAGGREAGGSPTATWRTCSRRGPRRVQPRRGRRGDRARAGADPPHLDRARASRPTSLEDALRRRRRAAALLGAVLDAGLPLVAFLQLVRVYGQALAQIADAEVKLFHLFVHEPMIRDGVAGARDRRGAVGPGVRAAAAGRRRSWTRVHQRLLQHFLEQDVVGHLELEVDRRRGARARAGGDRVRRPGGLHAADRGGGRGGGARGRRALRRAGERDAARRRARDQDDRRRGDGRRHGRRPRSSDWAVGFQKLRTERPLPRIGMHAARVLYRDGDYYGRAVNLAVAGGRAGDGRRGARHARGREAAGRHLAFQPIGEVQAQGVRRGHGAVPGGAGGAR